MKILRKSFEVKRNLAEIGFGSLAVVILSVFLGAVAPASAAQVNWGSERLATNLTSGPVEGAMDASFTFELGAFDPGFTPTAENRNQWVSRWHSAASAGYHETFRFFTGSVLVDGSIPAFSPSNRAYIWGFNARDAGQTVEWVLITNPTWTWPSSSGISTPVEWCVIDATTAVVGQINAQDGSCHMRSASLFVGPDRNDPLVWRDSTFGSSSTNAVVAGWDADPDGDGRSNLLEFALGTGALAGDGSSGIVLGSEMFGGATYQTLTVERVRRPAVDYIPEVSSDLVNWESGAGFIEVSEDSETRLMVRDRMPRKGNRRFMRLNVRLNTAN